MSSFSSTATLFGDWLSLNRSNRLKDANTICDDVQRNTYLLGEIIRANGAKQSVRGGSYIEERVRVSRQGNFAPYSPGDTRHPGRVSTLRTLRWGWRFFENPYTWTDADLDLSQGDQLTVFKSFKTHMDQELEIEHYEGMEDLLFKRPSSATMEPIDNQKGDTYSIPAYISENTTTFLPPASHWTSSDLAGLAPGTVDTWRNQQERFVTGQLDSPTVGIFAAFTKMFLKVKFNNPGGHKVYTESDALRAMKILTNTDGRAQYENLCRAGNDQFRGGPQDPAYGNPVYSGIPVMHISQLDSEPLEEAAGAYTGNPYPAGSPRYFFANFKHMKMVFHPKHFMHTTEPIGGSIQQRDAKAVFKVSWCNLTCTSRRRQGIVYPAAA